MTTQPGPMTKLGQEVNTALINTTHVPEALLLDSTLPATAKVLWILLSLPCEEETISLSQGALLAARGHFARGTVLRGLGRLEERVWARRDDNGLWLPVSGPHASGSLALFSVDSARRAAAVIEAKGRFAAVPTKLLEARGVTPQARVLYAVLQLVPGYAMGRGQCTYRMLSDLTGRALGTMRRAVRDLMATGWLEVEQKNTHAPLEYALTDPDQRREENEVAEAEEKLERAEYKGEAIMFAWLDTTADSDDFVDHARPGFLPNPFTGRRMELDRFYVSAKVAYEYNGSQHYEPTDEDPDKAKLMRQQARDDMKRGICERRGITVVTVKAEDLTLGKMVQKVEGLLPLRNLTRHQKLIDYLEQVSRAYRRKAREHEGCNP